jgi:hypothetical protein
MSRPWVALTALVLLLGPGALCAAETTKEFWPELQLWWRLNPGTQLLFNPAPTRMRETDDRSGIDWGFYVDHRVPKAPGSWRAGYVYSVTDPQGSRREENRIVLDYNHRWRFGNAWQLIDRTRLDLRDQEGNTSQRLRNRVQLEYEMKWAERGFVPYSNLELFYDTRYDAIARYKGELGATLVFSEQVDVTLYYGRQTDIKPQRRNVDALGLMLALHL